MTGQDKNRPLSPHLQVYRPQITSMLSILHRITGGGLAVGAVLVAFWLFAARHSDDMFAMTQTFRAHAIGKIMIFCWLFAFVYHLMNGIRHLAWDAGLGFNIKTTYITGWLVFIASILATIAIWVMGGGL